MPEQILAAGATRRRDVEVTIRYIHYIVSRIMMQLRDASRPLSFGVRAGLLESSTATPWAGLQFEVHRLKTAEEVGESGPLGGERGLLIVTRGSFETTLRGPSGDVRSRSSQGSILYLSGDDRPHVHRIDGSAEVMAIRVTPKWLDYLPVDPTRLGQCPLTGGHTVQSLVSAMREDVARGCAAGRLYAESLSISLLSYLFQRAPAIAPDHASATLSLAEQRRLTSYIHTHLDHNLGLARLAKLVGMPPRQLSTRFRHAFGTTPHRYVTRARLEEAARLLASGRHEIADIALRVGFCHQSHFTTAFRRTFGETPSRFALARRAPRPGRGRSEPE